MNKQMINARRAQAGFTLIELIVVIVILGILAATALPKFADLGGDARISTLKASRGALEATSAMVHGKFLVTSPVPTDVTLEGTTVGITNGYPTANANLADAAGLKATDWTVIAPGAAATANSPVTTATEIAIIPVSVAGSVKGLSCYVKYAQAVSATAAPVITVVTTSC